MLQNIFQNFFDIEMKAEKKSAKYSAACFGCPEGCRSCPGLVQIFFWRWRISHWSVQNVLAGTIHIDFTFWAQFILWRPASFASTECPTEQRIVGEMVQKILEEQNFLEFSRVGAEFSRGGCRIFKGVQNFPGVVQNFP